MDYYELDNLKINMATVDFEVFLNVYPSEHAHIYIRQIYIAYNV